MKRFVRIPVVLLLLLWGCVVVKGQQSIKLDLNAIGDTITFVNTHYDIANANNEYSLTLKFNGNASLYSDVLVKWSDTEESSRETISSSLSLSHTYPEGCHAFKILLFYAGAGVNADTVYAWALNKPLDVSFTIKDFGNDKSQGCLDYGADTLLMILSDMNNPPQTRYAVHVDGKNVPLLHGDPMAVPSECDLEIMQPGDIDLQMNWVQACRANQDEGRRDSIFLIFTEATGVKGALISMKMSCPYTNDQGRPKLLNKETTDFKKVSIFDKPNLRQIYRYSDMDSFPDRLDGVMEDLNFNICAVGKPAEFAFSDSWFYKYQTVVLGENSPERFDTTAFKVKYYYTEDSVSNGNMQLPGVTWTDVTNNPDYVNDTLLEFRRAGFYVMNVELSNKCNQPGEFDSLWTCLVRDEVNGGFRRDTFRYIQVYENLDAKLGYWGNDTFCLNVRDSIVLVDRNRRKFYDVPPQYSITIVDEDTHVEISKEEPVPFERTIVYKDGHVLNTGADAGNSSKFEHAGCDSTIIKLVFDKPGNYKVSWGRKGINCEDEKVKDFVFHIGDVPQITSDTLRDYFYGMSGFSIQNGNIYHCGRYDFAIPDLKKAFYDHNRIIDSVRFQFTKGDADTAYVYRPAIAGDDTFYFDRTGSQANYIRLNLFNGCGVSKTDSVIFYTPVQPGNLSVWRDGMPDNDTLCLGADYRYELKGRLPEKLLDSVKFSGNTKINGMDVAGGAFNFPLYKQDSSFGEILHKGEGEVIERYVVLNKEYPKCKASLTDTVVVVASPSALAYRDTVAYCASIDTLRTRLLFSEADTIFNRAEWGWTHTVAKTAKFPELLFRDGEPDTLTVTLLQSKGCYLRDTVIFKPQPLPDARLGLLEELCTPDTLNREKFLQFAQGGNLTLPGMIWGVYKNTLKTDSLLYYSSVNSPAVVLTEQSADSMGLIYTMQNAFVGMADFMDNGCISKDTLALKIHKPLLRILKKDTLDSSAGGAYNLSRIDPAYIESKDLLTSAWIWTSVGDGMMSLDTPPVYTLGTNDRTQDSIQFVVSGKTLCNEDIRDTLVVYIPRIRLYAHRDTICSNTEDYTLWGPGKTTGDFVDTSLLEWKIINMPSGSDWGHLSPAWAGDATQGRGSGVIFVPGPDVKQTDSVEIEVTGVYTGGISQKDTLKLWVNPAPEITPLAAGDTLIAIDGKIEITRIKALQYKNYSTLSAGIVVGQAQVQDTTISFGNGPADKNNRISAQITLRGLPGCADESTGALPMMALIKPEFRFSPDPLDMCAGEEYGLDSMMVFEKERKDRFTVLKWSREQGTGHFDADTLSYTAGNNGGIKVEKIGLQAYKNYMAYDSTRHSIAGEKHTLGMNIHVEPLIGLNGGKNRDTLCREDGSIPITVAKEGGGVNAWVLVGQDYYVDSLRFNGQRLPANGDYTFRKGAGETDTVYITVNQGRCKQWESENIQLYLYQMDEILKRKLSNVDVCEGGELVISYPVALTQKYSWSWDQEAGTLDTLGNGLSPVYHPSNTNQGEVVLHVIPKAGCEEETTFAKVTVKQKPQIELTDQMVCKKSGNHVDIPVNFVQGSSNDILGIDWFRQGEVVSIGHTGPDDSGFQYTLNDTDILQDTLYIIAKVGPKTPCENAYTYDTMQIILKGQPVITLSASEICQNGELELLKESGDLGWLKIENAADIIWENKSFGEFNEDTTKYLPGENSGTAKLNVLVKGVRGCADQSLEIRPEVKAAPVPSFSVISPTSCEKEQTTLEAALVNGITVAQRTWIIDSNSYAGEGREFVHAFQQAGDIRVKLRQEYSYSSISLTCPREVEQGVTIDPRPQADFENVTQVAKGKWSVIHNTSTPADALQTSGRSEWMISGLIRPLVSWDLGYQFDIAGSVNIGLTVTTDRGCSDQKSAVLEVVESPVADFEARVDSCGNTADFTLNTSQLNGAAVWWDWGYGNGWEADGRADLTQPLSKSYFVGYRDTVYTVRLELRNAADTVQKEVAVRFISKLDVDFEILPETSGCHDIYRKIAIEVKGKADDSYVDWGDESSYTVFDAATVGILQHRFENTTPMPLTDTIRLKVSNSCYADSAFRTLKVLPLSVSVEPAIVGNVSPCFGPDDELKVRNASVGFDEETREWGWKFESDADALIQMNADTAVYSYPAPGIYKVTLWMKDRCNEDTSSVFVTVRGNDSLYFDILARPYCTGKEVTMKFTQKGHPDFGDLKWTIYEAGTGRSVKTAMNVTELSHKFDKAGDYHVLLYAKADDCPDQQTLPLHINETPEPMISLINGSTDRGCEPWTVEFQAADGSSLLQMPRILWDFRNEVASSQQKEKVEFRTKGVYDVTLTLTSDSGCVNTDHRAITVLHSPRIDFVLNDSLFCTQNGSFEVTAANVSEDLDSCRFEWFKKIGTGASESIANTPQIPPLNFSGVSGPIDLKLQATYLPTGCPAELVKRIVASDKVTAAIYKDVEHVCLDYPVYFASRSENATRVRWDMGDGNVTVDTAFEYTFSRIGDYNIRLTVENEDGCQDSVPLSFTVYPLPVADFVWKKDNSVPAGYPDSLNLPEIDNGGVEFTNYSTVSPDDWGTELHYRWDFGDSTGINTAKDPVHHFANNGMYEVWLKTITRYGCVDSSSSVVSIDAVKGLYLPTAFAPAMPDEELGRGNDYRGAARFQAKGIGLYYYKIQIYDPWSGTCVWSSEALNNGQPAEYWDGKFNGADLPAGNYIWKVKAIFIDGTVWMNEKGKTEGNVILIR